MRYDVMVYSDEKGWETVLRAVSIYEAESYERLHWTKHVSITASVWSDTEPEYRPV